MRAIGTSRLARYTGVHITDLSNVGLGTSRSADLGTRPALSVLNKWSRVDDVWRIFDGNLRNFEIALRILEIDILHNSFEIA